MTIVTARMSRANVSRHCFERLVSVLSRCRHSNISVSTLQSLGLVSVSRLWRLDLISVSASYVSFTTLRWTLWWLSHWVGQLVCSLSVLCGWVYCDLVCSWSAVECTTTQTGTSRLLGPIKTEFLVSAVVIRTSPTVTLGLNSGTKRSVVGLALNGD